MKMVEDGDRMVPETNSRLSDVKYGETTYFLFFGMVAKRDFKELYCESCGEQIKAYYINNNTCRHKFFLITNSKFNILKFCKRPECVNKYKTTKKTKVKKATNARIKVPLMHNDVMYKRFVGLR